MPGVAARMFGFGGTAPTIFSVLDFERHYGLSPMQDETPAASAPKPILHVLLPWNGPAAIDKCWNDSCPPLYRDLIGAFGQLFGRTVTVLRYDFALEVQARDQELLRM